MTDKSREKRLRKEKALLSALLYMTVKVLGKDNTLTLPKAREVEGAPRHQFSYEIIGDDIVILLEEFDGDLDSGNSG